jgi:uncharacterized membrane protein YeaQ/YmgE (transglycosylase-associated protein family)
VTLEQVVLWVIVGGLAGLLADAFVKGIRLGLAEAIVVGMLGGLIGGWRSGCSVSPSAAASWGTSLLPTWAPSCSSLSCAD